MKTGKRLAALVCVVVLMVTAMMPVTMAAEETWVCPNCEKVNSGNFCGNCGTKKPSWLCVCGKENIGNFCENCGLPKDQAIAAAIAARKAKVKAFKTVGDYVTFGTYEQDNNTANGKEAIEWLVLDVQENKSLLISRYALDYKQYHTSYEDITWEKCSLRTWLNGTFLNTAFSTSEQNAILMTAVDNSEYQGYSGWNTNGGKNTQDKVFLLSFTEVGQFFKNNNECCCSSTTYAKSHGALTDENNKTNEQSTCFWWLRSPGHTQLFASCIDNTGSRSNRNVSTHNIAVRPVIWLDLESVSIDEVGHLAAQETHESVQLPYRIVGNYVVFGSYEQDNDLLNGKEEIEWIVLNVQDDEAFLVSRYALDCQRYNQTKTSITWEECTLRSWLNDYFLNTAFTLAEQKAIMNTEVDNSKNQGYSDYNSDGGNNTQDKIFLLSYMEAWKYFESDSARCCIATPYVRAQEIKTESNGVCWWWLRSPGYSQGFVGIVGNRGNRTYFIPELNAYGVRPAIRIKLESNFISEADILRTLINPEGKTYAKDGTQPFRTIGNHVFFGEYEQDNNLSNGKEAIEWEVLDVQGNKVLLISERALDCQQYNDMYANITWEECTLRGWLNDIFLSTAFSETQQKAILTTEVDNSNSQGYRWFSTKGGKTTQDKIFLLSYDEACKYFKDNSARRCWATSYAKEQGARTSDKNCSWWLRSPGKFQTETIIIIIDGSSDNTIVNFSDYAVRPAFWLNLESDIF